MSLSQWLEMDLTAKIKDDEDFHHNSEDIADDIIDGKFAVSAFVGKLSGVLTDTNVEYRMRGMLLLSRVLSFFPETFLSKSELHFVGTFYVDRLKDNHRVIPPTMEGLFNIVKMRNLPKDIPCKILLGINQNVPCQQQIRADRNTIYNIFRVLLQNYKTELKSMGPDLVYTILTAMDGERDPRNLLLLFKFLPDFLQSVPLAHLTEEMFEVIACYYPIDFSPVENDPNAISRDVLAEKLGDCLCAIPEFAEFCIPLLMEKLVSDLNLAKVDSMKLLIQSFNTFKIEDYNVHLPTLWNCFQKELLHNTTRSLDLDHKCLSLLVENVCSQDDVKPGETLLKLIVDSVKVPLTEAKTEDLLSLPLDVLLTVAQSCQRACLFVAQNATPFIIMHYNIIEDNQRRTLSLKWFLAVFLDCRKWNIQSQVEEIFSQIPKMCISNLIGDDDDIKVTCFKVLVGLAEIIPVSDVDILCDIIDEHFRSNCPTVVQDNNKFCFLALIKVQPDTFKDYIMNKLNFDNFTDSEFTFNKNLDSLCSLTSVNVYSDIIMDKLTRILQGPDVKLINAVFTHLASNLEKKDLFHDRYIAEMQRKYDLVDLISLCITRDMNYFESNINDISKLITIIVRVLVNQEELILEYVPKFVDKVPKNVFYIYIVEAFLSSVHPGVDVDKVFKDVIRCARNVISNHEQDAILIKAYLILANIFNKFIHKEEVFKEHETIINDLLKIVYENNPRAISQKDVDLCGWICKSLSLNGHQDSKMWLKYLIEILSIDEWSRQVPKQFKFLMSESSEALNKTCFSKISVFYRQKIFHIFRQLTTDTTKINDKQSYLLSYAYLIQGLPKFVIEMEAPVITTVLIESLSSTDADLLKTNLSSLSFLIENQNEFVLKSLQSLIPRCLTLTIFESSMQVRIASVECLYNIAKCYPTVSTLPYREDVVGELAVPLDDKKRLVRTVAVKARNRWFMVGAPGENK